MIERNDGEKERPRKKRQIRERDIAKDIDRI